MVYGSLVGIKIRSFMIDYQTGFQHGNNVHGGFAFHKNATESCQFIGSRVGNVKGAADWSKQPIRSIGLATRWMAYPLDSTEISEIGQRHGT